MSKKKPDYIWPHTEKVGNKNILVPGFWTASSTRVGRYTDFIPSSRQGVISSLGRQRVTDPKQIQEILNRGGGDFSLKEIVGRQKLKKGYKL